MASARRLLYGSALYHLSLSGRTPAALAFRLPEPWPGDPERGAALLDGTLAFAGETVRAATPPWTGDRSPRWRSALHRFDFLADLVSLGTDDAKALARNWTADWLARCDVYDPLSWRSDVVGDRLFHWLEHVADLTAGADPAFARRLLVSMARQTRHLSRAAGSDIVGLGRLKALRGLVAAAAALRFSARLAKALAGLEREITQQILPDGGHPSRNPETQLDALALLLDARAALVAAHREVPNFLQHGIDRAAPMVRFFRHGDGKFALFNGGNEGDIGAIDLVLGRADAKGRPPFSAPQIGFERLQAGRSYVVADCGRPPPPGFALDAHAGTLSFEMSHGRERIIVNCGAYHGTNPDWRLVTRATAAHSTLVVADTNSAEIRPDGSLGRGPMKVTCERAEEDGSLWVAATHDGYGPSFGLTHARQLFLAADGDDLRGEDRLTGKPGRGFAIRFHLHPSVQASLTQDGATVLLRTPSGAGWRLKAEGAVMSLGESIYLGSGERRKTQQIILDGHVGTAGAAVRWAIRRETKKVAEAAVAERGLDVE